MVCHSNLQLNGRQKHFARTILERGFYIALKCAGYSKSHGFALMKDPRLKEYQLGLLDVAMDEIGLTLGQLIKERHALANDEDTPSKLRDDIYKDLIGMVKDAGENTEEALRLTGGTRKMLKPSREIPYEEIKNKDNDNASKESNEEVRNEESHTTDGVRTEANNRSATGDVSEVA